MTTTVPSIFLFDFRYGDGLNPWGDLITMARTWCMLKPGGKILVGVPVNKQEVTYFNAGRTYGPKLLSQLFANFKLLHTNNRYVDQSNQMCEWCYQPLFLLEKIS